MQITVTDIFPWNKTDENTNQFSAKHYASTFNERRKDVLSYKIITGKTTNPNPKINSTLSHVRKSGFVDQSNMFKANNISTKSNFN